MEELKDSYFTIAEAAECAMRERSSKFLSYAYPVKSEVEEAEALSDHIGIMREGNLLIYDTAENIKNYAQTDTFEAAFIKIVKEAKL